LEGQIDRRLYVLAEGQNIGELFQNIADVVVGEPLVDSCRGGCNVVVGVPIIKPFFIDLDEILEIVVYSDSAAYGLADSLGYALVDCHCD
jgi:hypothetical protein